MAIDVKWQEQSKRKEKEKKKEQQEVGKPPEI
jgi:hypothetical protein